MAISVTNIGTATSTSGATIAIAVPAGGVPSGALIVFTLYDASTSLTSNSVADTVNTYTSTPAIDANGLAANGFGQMWYSANVSALTSSNTITYTKALTGAVGVASACYATGIATTSPLDTAVTASATGTGATPSVTSGTPAVAGELFIGLAVNGIGVGASAFTQDTGHSWAAPPNAVFAGSSNSRVAIMAGNQVNAGTGTLVYSPTLSGTGRNWAALIFGFTALAGSTYSVSVSESGAAADTTDASGVFPSAVAESGSLADTISSIATFVSGLTEAGALVDTTSSAVVFLAPLADTTSLADIVSAMGVFAPSLAEAGSLADAAGTTVVFLSPVAELASLADSVSALGVFGVSAVELGTLTDSPDATGVFGASAAEAGTLADLLSAAGTFAPAIAEFAAAMDFPAATGSFLVAEIETGALLDQTGVVVPMYTPFFPLYGGLYGVDVIAGGFGGGLVELDIMAADYVTSVPAGATFASNGLRMVNLPPGQYRFMIEGATDVYAAISRVVGRRAP